LALLAYFDLELGEAGLDVGRGDPHRQLNASKDPLLAAVGTALRRDCNMAMLSPARQQASPLVGRALDAGRSFMKYMASGASNIYGDKPKTSDSKL
jgi:hypothetical protein